MINKEYIIRELNSNNFDSLLFNYIIEQNHPKLHKPELINAFISWIHMMDFQFGESYTKQILSYLFEKYNINVLISKEGRVINYV